MNPFQIVIEIAKNAVATVIPWRTPLDYCDDWHFYGEEVFKKHVESLNSLGFTVTGKDVLEIGPGPSLWAIYLCRTHGATTATAIDVRRCLVNGGCPADVFAQVRYLVPCAAEDIDIPPTSFDLIYSQAVLEHVRAPERVVAEQWRLLRPGGYASHQIDTRNHFDFSRPTDHQRVPEAVWRMMTSNRSVYTNRYTVQRWVDLFAHQGFDVLEARETTSIESPDEPDGGLWVRARKPTASF